MASTTSVVGGLAALSLGHQSSKAQNPGPDVRVSGPATITVTDPGPSQSSTPKTPQPPTVVVQHVDDAANLHAKDHTNQVTVTGAKSVTLVATPKTQKWGTIIALLVVGVVGLLTVIIYSVLKPNDT